MIGDTALVDLSITEGTGFGTNFNADDVNVTPWGQLSIAFTSCGTAEVSFNSLDSTFGSGNMSVQRLTTGPVDYKGACQL